MKYIITYLFVVLLFPLLSFGQTHKIDSIIESKLTYTSEKPVHNILIQIQNTRGTKSFHKGINHKGKDSILVSGQEQFKAASSTKLFVATIILQLMEEGKLNLNDKASKFLKNIAFLNFENFHLYNKQKFSSQITIEQLLSHRSGLADIFNDKEEDFFGILLQNPKKTYSPKSIVELYFKFKLNQSAHFKPNEGWHYSDMNYLLLGLIIEQIEQNSLAESIRSRILEPLEMNETYFEFYEKPTSKNNLIHQYVGNLNFSEINTSFDWSGGGLVSSNKDLITFITSLFDLKLISKNSLQKMTDVQYTKEHEYRYGLGMYESKYNGKTYYGHYGFYGTYVGYCPETKTAISYSINQALADFNRHTFVSGILKLIE
ncbi:serine hydrolase domain-containing protein [Tenacibaculum sp. 190524A05c]|uniref:serine hydrolase domain-containing protein n=1 Tax=Tenacibaculum platacis TaxID=3137852 RepID=UPI0032B18656